MELPGRQRSYSGVPHVGALTQKKMSYGRIFEGGTDIERSPGHRTCDFYRSINRNWNSEHRRTVLTKGRNSEIFGYDFAGLDICLREGE
jgi:hypothetical protein